MSEGRNCLPSRFRRPLASLVAVIALVAAKADAAPLLSGTYALTQSLMCQVRAKVDSTTGQITIGKHDTGSEGFAVSTITFDSNAGTYSSNGVAITESQILEKFSDGSHGGFRVKHYPASDSGPYSNGDSTLTLKSFVFDVVYTKIENGVADGFTAIYAQAGPQSCVDNLIAQKQ